MTKAVHTRITFRPPSGRPTVIIVAGKPSTWDGRIGRWIRIRKESSMTFKDVITGKSTEVGLMDFDTFKCEVDEY
jgi:hypothetical protein